MFRFDAYIGLCSLVPQVENKKRQLEDEVDTLQDEVTKLKAVSDMHHTASKELEAKEAELQSSLTSQMAQHRESHQKQVGPEFQNLFQICAKDSFNYYV